MCARAVKALPEHFLVLGSSHTRLVESCCPVSFPGAGNSICKGGVTVVFFEVPWDLASLKTSRVMMRGNGRRAKGI